MAVARRWQLSRWRRCRRRGWRRVCSPACRRLSAAPGRGLPTAALSTRKGPRAHSGSLSVPKGRAWHLHSGEHATCGKGSRRGQSTAFTQQVLSASLHSVLQQSKVSSRYYVVFYSQIQYGCCVPYELQFMCTRKHLICMSPGVATSEKSGRAPAGGGTE